MTKTQKQKEIIKRFLTFVDEAFPEYTIDDYGDGGRIEFFPTEGNTDDAIEFQRSRLTLDVLNWASDQAKQDCKVMEGMLKIITQEVESESN